jgi:hypothetical protein
MEVAIPINPKNPNPPIAAMIYGNEKLKFYPNANH